MTTGVEELVTQYLTGIRPGGQQLAAICPFHHRTDGTTERNPSFSISTTTGLWQCFSCGERGNLRSFLRQIGVAPLLIDTIYKDVLEGVAAQVPLATAPNVLRASSPPIQEAVLGLFDYCPLALLQEGFTEGVLQRFDVGYDERNRRITFPLRDLTGRLIGIRGRAVDADDIRFLTYGPHQFARWELPAYAPPKTHWIWNYERVIASLYYEPHPELVIVEGFKACMWVHQAGLTNVVALGGSAMSEMQQMMLERLGGTVYLFLDNDDAGRKGLREIGYRLARSVNVRIPQYHGKQPTDLAADELRQALSGSIDYVTWRLQQCLVKTRIS